MAKPEVVSSSVAALQSALASAQLQAITDSSNSLYDQAFSEGVASVPPVSGGLSQADVAAAVAAARSEDAKALADAQAADAKVLSDSVAAMQVQLDLANQALADMTAKDKKDSAAALALKASVVSIQAALDTLSALVADPAPVDPQPAA